MPTYTYKARDKFGKLVSGILTVDTQDIALKTIKDMGHAPISCDETRYRAPLFSFQFVSVSLQELNAFTRQLHSLTKAGLSLLVSLESIAQQTKTKYFSGVISQIANDIRAGLSFSQALAKHPRIFDEIFVGMVRAGEVSGTLPVILERLTELTERDIDTRAKIKASTRYPLIALFTLGAGFLILVTFVIPRFAAVYAQFNTELPLPTRILIWINIFIRQYWYIVIGAGIGLFFGIRFFIRSSFGRPVWDAVKIKAPVFGPLVSMLIMSRFARITGILMKSGVPILEVLTIVADAAGNVIIGRAIRSIRESVNQGKGISEPMRDSGLFPVAVVQMVAAGEKTGSVGDMLLEVADYYDKESGYIIRQLTTYIEPILIFVLALMVLLLALGIFLPMWRLISVFRH